MGVRHMSLDWQVLVVAACLLAAGWHVVRRFLTWIAPPTAPGGRCAGCVTCAARISPELVQVSFLSNPSPGGPNPPGD